MVRANYLLKDLNFIQLLAGIIFVLIVGSLWKRTLDNFTYGTLKLNKNSTYDTFIIATSTTIVVLILLLSVNNNSLLLEEDSLGIIADSLTNELENNQDTDLSPINNLTILNNADQN